MKLYVYTGPAFIDFEDVCMRSINTKHINIVNNLEAHIYVQVTVSTASFYIETM